MQSSLTNLSVKQQEQAIGLRKYITAFALIIIVCRISLSHTFHRSFNLSYDRLCPL